MNGAAAALPVYSLRSVLNHTSGRRGAAPPRRHGSTVRLVPGGPIVEIVHDEIGALRSA